MYDKMILYIRNKLFEKNEIYDHFDVPTDKQIMYIMLTTLEIVNEECQQCFYCKNYKRFALGSLCKIKPHIEKNCFHFTLDVNKVLKKKYYHIRITLSECTRGQHLIGKDISQKTIKNIMYESIRLSESLKDMRALKNTVPENEDLKDEVKL